VRVRDALDREVQLDGPARRVVSLVPSETESVAALAGLDRLVARTEYCEEPAGAIESVPTVGGTKKADVDAIVQLAPDLVLANQEENGRRDVERLIDAGLTVHVSFPCTVAESLAYVIRLAALLGVPAPAIEAPPRRPGAARVFAPVWKDPWMTFDGRTYASDLLAHVGADNVFADRPRRYPLAADVADAAPVDAGERDTRYPRTTLDEVRARRPDLVLLPDEPYAFDETHAAALRDSGIAARIDLVSGKDLFWYGLRTFGAVRRLQALIGR